MSGPLDPLWLVLRAALAEKGEALDGTPLSVRKASKLLNELDDRQTKESWKRTLNRILDEDAERPYSPKQETAEVLARFFDKPLDHFVRPQERKTARERALEEENARLRRENEGFRRRLESDVQAGGGSL